ncbi:phosphate regulon sensor histidine kinase PhoR [Methylonatrum kenyense]|nr:phosphate regulon sensor histidine kinase PhoR [Methylonatrum kenyense]
MVTAVSAAIGFLVGHLLLGLFLGTAVYLVWNIHNQVRLERWLRQGRSLEPPDSSGLWGEIFNGIHRLQRRQRGRRRKLAKILQGIREGINAMPDGAVILRENGEIQWWNGPAGDMLGLSWPQDEGQRIANLFRHPEFGAFVRREEQETSTITVPSPVNEELMLEIRLIPYAENQRLMLARDITRLYRLERMRRDFVANISHELRTPLTVIQGVSENLSDQLGHAEAQVRRALELIHQQSLRMDRLVEDLLTLSRLETEQRPVEMKPVNMPELLRVLGEEAKTLSAENGHEITLDVDPGLWILGEESELRSALSNLVFNAVKYTQSGGRIRVLWQRRGNRAHFQVEDNGPGISPQHLPRLTERFYRVDSGRSSRTGGTGLGLSIVKHVLGRYGTRLQIHSEAGEGSRFSVTFPERLTLEEGTGDHDRSDSGFSEQGRSDSGFSVQFSDKDKDEDQGKRRENSR